MTRFSLLAIAALTACSSGPDTSTAGGFLAGYTTTVCEAAHACRAQFTSDTNTRFDAIFGDSVAECFAGPLVDPAALDASVAAGRVAYNATDGEVCLDAIASAPCDALFDEFDSVFNDDIASGPFFGTCPTTLIGKVEEGGVCATDLDCKPSEDTAYCDSENNTCTTNK